ncbi:hypothetical protein [Nitrosomonas sp.]|uniref:hypothetical protein n=1 Tax=Nitrosomonas sp. TaxID=42353 RepID=UPI002606A863|nr:hypothetical protein [Nitrosomonas sp.]
MLWLPAQGAAAAVLSVCVQEKNLNDHHDKPAITIDNHHHDDCHQQTANSATDHVLASLPCNDASCDAYSNTPLVPDYVAPMLTNKTSDVFTLNAGFISFVPEQPQRPPLTASL